MTIEKYLEIVEKQLMNLRNLYDTVNLKKESLVNLDYTKFEESLAKEQKIITIIQNTEKIRLTALKELILSFGSEKEFMKTRELINYLKGKVDKKYLRQLYNYENEIRDKVKDIKYVNELNKMLIKHSSNFIKETITHLFNSKKKSLLDKKI